jgi:hypothetical protein
MLVVMLVVIVVQVVAVLGSGHWRGASTALRFLHAWREIGFGCHV